MDVSLGRGSGVRGHVRDYAERFDEKFPVGSSSSFRSVIIRLSFRRQLGQQNGS